VARRTLITALALLALCFPASALAGDDDGEREERAETRSGGVCTGAIRSELRLRADDGRIRVELRLDRVPRRGAWRVIVLHERRIAYRGRLAPRSSSASIRVRVDVDDLFGPDAVVVRATGSRGESCRVSATV
jgi:hypothetical protein